MTDGKAQSQAQTQAQSASTGSANRDALSRALGAAFLTHQVEQLEKTVGGTTPGVISSQVGSGAGGGDRRRRSSPIAELGSGARGHGRGGNGGGGRRGAAGGRVHNSRPRSGEVMKGFDSDKGSDLDERMLGPEAKGAREAPAEKNADIVVVDASVLVHALGQLKIWCRNDREEVVLIPLEALNTLDLLKKGMTPLAQRARAASRILEQQVGTNPRIRVQRDDAFVLWDNIPFAKDNKPDDGISAVGDTKLPSQTPEWLRRTICCARWELNHATASIPDGKEKDSRAQPRVAVVVCLISFEAAATKDAADSAPVSASPVPLPAPHPLKHEQRCAGALVAQWAKKAGVHVIEVPPTPQPGAAPPGASGAAKLRPRTTRHMRGSSDEEWRSAGPRKGVHQQKPKGGTRNDGPGGEKMVIFGSGRGGAVGKQDRRNSGALVERPAATMAMMQQNQAIRVLARGEKLEP